MSQEHAAPRAELEPSHPSPDPIRLLAPPSDSVRLALHAGPLTPWFHHHLVAEAAVHGAAPPPIEAVHDRVVQWRSWISEGLQRQGHLTRPLDWSEDREARPQPVAAPIPTAPIPPALAPAHLAVEALQALKLLLVYDDGQGPAPAELPARPELDPQWVAAAESGFDDVGYAQVLVPEFWLPASFSFTFACPYPDGHEVQAGSLDDLRSQLHELTEKVFQTTPFDWPRWEAQAARPTRVTRVLAQQAVAVLGRQAEAAWSAGQPMWLAPPIETR